MKVKFQNIHRGADSGQPDKTLENVRNLRKYEREMQKGKVQVIGKQAHKSSEDAQAAGLARFKKVWAR